MLVVARPEWLAGTRPVAHGAVAARSRTGVAGPMPDSIRPWVTADSARPQASTTKLGARAEISWDAVRQASDSRSARRRGQSAVQRTSGMVVTAATRAYQASNVPTIGTLT